MIDNNLPLITVIVPCYKVERYLKRCVNSILRQTYSNLEIILIDDGSPDNTGVMCDEYLLKDSRVKVIHKANGGLSDARNVALDVFRGEYVTFVDSDDWVDVTYVQCLYEMLIETGADISVINFKQVVESEKSEYGYDGVKSASYSVLDCYQAIEKMFYQEMFDTTAHCKMYKAELFFSLRFTKGIVFEDLALIYQIFLLANRIVVSPSQLYFYYLRRDSIEGEVFSDKKYNDTMFVYEQIINDDRLRNISDSVTCRMFSFLFRLYLSMPSDDERKKDLWHKLIVMRNKVLFNSNGRKKARIAAFLTYAGESVVEQIYKKIKRR